MKCFFFKGLNKRHCSNIKNSKGNDFRTNRKIKNKKISSFILKNWKLIKKIKGNFCLKKERNQRLKEKNKEKSNHEQKVENECSIFNKS